MQELYSPKTYPQEIKAELKAMSPLSIEIANRWLRLFTETSESTDRGEPVSASTQGAGRSGGMSLSQNGQHLARHEIAELYGLDSAPHL